MSLWAEQSSRCSSVARDTDCDLMGLFRNVVQAGLFLAIRYFKEWRRYLSRLLFKKS